MKILSLTAGAAGMYCGSCFRDNALAAALGRLGHDVTLQPVYTPTRTDEANVSDTSHVLFGGINVYLQQQSAFFRHLPGVVDRVLDAPRVIRSLAKRSIATSPAVLGELTVSMLRGEAGVLGREFEKLAAWMRREPLPDVINLPNSLLIAMAEPLKRVTGRPVCCTLQGEELFLDGLHQPYRDQALDLIRSQVRTVDRFVAVSEYSARHMATYLDIPRDRISVVPLGIAFDGYPSAYSPAPRTPPRIGYFARIAREKGLHALAAAYVVLHQRLGPATPALVAAGYMSAVDRPYLEQVKGSLAAAGCADRFSYEGELDRSAKIRLLSGLTTLSVPAPYDEPKGMFLLEAMAAGVPVVQPRRGAFVEVVEKTGGGVLVDDDSAEALADGLARVVGDAELAATLGERAFHGVRQHYDVRQSAASQVAVYADVMSRFGLPVPAPSRRAEHR